MTRGDVRAGGDLVPPDAAARMPLGRNKAATRAFAEAIGVSPGVVLGRIQRMTGDYARGHDLEVRFELAPRT